MSSNVFGYNFGQGEAELDKSLEPALKHYCDKLAEQGKTAVSYVTSHPAVSELRVRDENGECARIIYGTLPSEERGCIYEKIVIVGADVNDDAVAILADKKRYPNNFLFHSCQGQIRPDDLRLCYMRIAEMYARATTPAPAAEAVTEQKAPEQPAKKHISIVDAPILAQRVIEVNGPGAEPDAEFEEVDVSDLVEEYAPASQPAAEQRRVLEDAFKEEVCRGITRIKLADIEFATKPGSDETYSYITTETAMLTIMAGAFDDLVNVEYDRAVMISDEVAFDFGSREMLRPYEQRAEQPITKEQQKALVDRLKEALAERPEAEIKATAKAILQRGRIYAALAEFFGDNKESLYFYQLDKPGMEATIGRIVPQRGTVAIYCFDESVMKEVVDTLLRRRKDVKFEDVVDKENHALRVNGWRIYFVGSTTKRIFDKYVPEVEEISNLGDLLLATMDEADGNKRARRITPPKGVAAKDTEKK